MKVGFRTPSVKRSISARMTGQAKRAIKRALIPGYGKRGMDILHPKKALYIYFVPNADARRSYSMMMAHVRAI